ncbi:hypothetical protein CT0861_09378 [Colletotrichum tofieldiae]|uniref:Uncharacterized protein n=1 Tax=Colletotrichum tofieldiae TaxID=708197 RepID=A0A161YIA9_9PEZI|nr:hypothetical protein CT0861_09378 [Colletotrichum tofieldiae]
MRGLKTQIPKWKPYESIPAADPGYEDDRESVDSGMVHKIRHNSSHHGASGAFKVVAYFLSGFLLATALGVAVLWSQETAQVRRHVNSYTPPDPRAFPELYFSDEIDPPPMLNRSCGSTPTEARNAGCVFDLLTTAWTPVECADLDLTREWLEVVTKEGNKWPFYHDKDGKHPQRDLAHLQSGEWDGELWSTLRLHRYHCLFIWRKMHMAYLHCEKMMMMSVDPNKVSGVQSVYYRTC